MVVRETQEQCGAGMKECRAGTNAVVGWHEARLISRETSGRQDTWGCQALAEAGWYRVPGPPGRCMGPADEEVLGGGPGGPGGSRRAAAAAAAAGRVLHVRTFCCGARAALAPPPPHAMRLHLDLRPGCRWACIAALSWHVPPPSPGRFGALMSPGALTLSRTASAASAAAAAAPPPAETDHPSPRVSSPPPLCRKA
jgi:hypothetical protein